MSRRPTETSASTRAEQVVSRTRSSHTHAASSIANFGFKRDTRIIELLVPLRFRSSYQSVQLGLTSFGIGALAPHLGNGDNSKRRGPGAPGTAVITKTKPQTKRPSLYRVLLLNDDYTPMEFVVHVLERFFNKDHESAQRIMMHVHQHGIGECGVYTYEVAETKVTQVMDFARKHQHPLQCVMEKK